jgi:hypothetical protein
LHQQYKGISIASNDCINSTKELVLQVMQVVLQVKDCYRPISRMAIHGLPCALLAGSVLLLPYQNQHSMTRCSPSTQWPSALERETLHCKRKDSIRELVWLHLLCLLLVRTDSVRARHSKLQQLLKRFSPPMVSPCLPPSPMYQLVR